MAEHAAYFVHCLIQMIGQLPELVLSPIIHPAGKVTLPKSLGERGECRSCTDRQERRVKTAPSWLRGPFAAIAVSPDGRLLAVAGIHGGGSPEAERLAISRSYDLEARKGMARRAAGIAS